MLMWLRFAVFASVLLFTVVNADTVPSCLATCLTQTSDPCTPASLSVLITCLNRVCPISAHQAAAAAVHLSYTPKSQYSCQNSVIPYDSGVSSSPLQLSGNGTCVASPFAFKSFVATGATSGMNSDACDIFVYDGSDCEGEGTKVTLLGGEPEGCQFVGGNSAQLVCQGAQLMTQVVRAKLTSMCSNSTTVPSGSYTPPPAFSYPTSNITTPTTTPHSYTQSSNVTIHPTHSSVTKPTTSSYAGMPTLTATFAPIKALAVFDSHADASIAALVAVAAALVIL